ncbi:DNA-binding transcriptional LysR family regulator [Oxalobacteraceae bacterium GrIS 2.11]
MANKINDWQLFRAFLAVVREGSLSGAARVLQTTQPTMGRQVAALEQALGVKLFTRSLDGLAPTEAGMQLIASAETMAAAVDAAQRSASGAVEAERGTVRVTASDVMGSEVLPALLAEFSVLHPGIAVELALSNRNEDLLRGDADIAVRMVRPTQGALVAKRIGQIDVGLYAHKRYLKANPMPHSLKELKDHTLIGFDRDPAYLRLLDRKGVMLTPDNFRFRSDSDLAQLAALRAGFGIGASQLGIARRDKNLVAVMHAELIIPMEVWLVMHNDLRSVRRIRLLFDHLALRLATYVQSSHA